MNARETTVDDAAIIVLPVVDTGVGHLVTCDESSLPFDPRRVFYLYDIPAGESRGAHAHVECHQLLVAVSGSFEVSLKDGRKERVVSLNQPTEGLHIPPGVWAAEERFSGGAICLVLTSHEYVEEDYLRNWENYLQFKE